MAQLSADLELTIDSALSAINDLAGALNDSVDSFGSALTDAIDSALQPQVLEVDADATAAEETVEALSEIPVDVEVDADAAEAEEAVDGLSEIPVDVQVTADTSEAVDAEEALSDIEVDVSVTADTSEALASIEGLGGASFSVDTGDSEASLQGLGVAAGIATGNLGAVKGASTALPGPLKSLAAGGLIAVGVFGELFRAGMENNTSMQRYKMVVGEFGESLNTLNVGDVNMDLQEMALAFGSDESAIKNANASLFNFATQVGGATGPAAAAFTEKIDFLAARAVALNPALGSVAEVAGTMAPKLARGGKFASNFGIGLSATEISAEALATKLEDLGLTSEAAAVRSGDLTSMTEAQTIAISAAKDGISIYDKSAAGASIAVKKYAKSQKLISEGAENATNKQRALSATIGAIMEDLGAPLVAPVFEIIKSLTPAVEIFGRIFSELARGILPAFAEILKANEPLILLFADIMKELSPLIRFVARAMMLVLNPITLLTAALGDEKIKEFTDWIREAAGEVAKFVKPLTDAVKAFDWEGALNTLKSAVKTTFAAISDAVSVAWNNVIKPALDGMAWLIENIVIPVLETLWDVQVAVWGAISDAISFAWDNVIKPTYDLMTTFVNKVLIPGFNLLSDVVTTVWRAISSTISFAWNSIISPAYQGIKTGFQSIIDFFVGSYHFVVDPFVNMANGMANAFKGGFNAIAGFWNRTIGAISFDLPFGIGGFDVPNMPTLHEGGIVPGRAGMDVAAILQAGELVISRPQLKALMSNQPLPQASQSSSPVIGTMTVIGQDPVSTAAAVGRELAFQRRFQGGT